MIQFRFKKSEDKTLLIACSSLFTIIIGIIGFILDSIVGLVYIYAGFIGLIISAWHIAISQSSDQKEAEG